MEEDGFAGAATYECGGHTWGGLHHCYLCELDEVVLVTALVEKV